MQTDKLISEARAEAEQNRRSAQREVDELTRQRDSITGHLDQLRALLGQPPVPTPSYTEAVPAQQGGPTTETAADIAGKKNG
jgi:hypothetical protein